MGMTHTISVVAKLPVKVKVINSFQETAEVPFEVSFVRAVVFRRSVLLASLYNCDTASGPFSGRATLTTLKQVAQLWQRPCEIDQRFQMGGGFNLRLNYRLKGYFSRYCDITPFTSTHHMVIEPILLLGLAVEYRS